MAVEAFCSDNLKSLKYVKNPQRVSSVAFMFTVVLNDGRQNLRFHSPFSTYSMSDIRINSYGTKI